MSNLTLKGADAAPRLDNPTGIKDVTKLTDQQKQALLGDEKLVKFDPPWKQAQSLGHLKDGRKPGSVGKQNRNVTVVTTNIKGFNPTYKAPSSKFAEDFIKDKPGYGIVEYGSKPIKNSKGEIRKGANGKPITTPRQIYILNPSQVKQFNSRATRGKDGLPLNARR